MSEPGLDRQQWVTEWAALEPLLEDSPVESLSELDDLVELGQRFDGRIFEKRLEGRPFGHPLLAVEPGLGHGLLLPWGPSVSNTGPPL